MATTFVLIDKATVGSGGAASVTFSSIPQTYTDLKVVVSGRTDYSGGGTAAAYLTFNGNSANYSSLALQANGSTATSTTNTAGTTSLFFGFIPGTTYTSNTFGSYDIYVPNYTSANNKSVSIDSVTENNATTSYANLIAGLWSNTSAITSITFNPEPATGNWAQYSNFYLYGIKNS